ncbi:MAG TPA: hypothetical protein VKX35_06690, partial [Fermentimonas sp.]|nr:hypothetical protein [Fermentimonas sp.]
MNNKKYLRLHSTVSIKYRIFFFLFILLISQTHAQGFSLSIIPTVKDLVSSKSLTENSVVRVLGYYEVGDGGSAEYIIKENSTSTDSQNDYYIELKGGMKAYLLEPSFINYKMFGAKGNGVSNDAVEIAKAHEYANAKNLPVVNTKGEFWLKEVHKIYIETDVNWGNTIFYIDEKYNTKQDPRFEVRSKNSPQEIKFSEDEKKELLSSLNSGVTTIPMLEPFKNHLLIMQDREDRVGYRYGARYNSSSW